MPARLMVHEVDPAKELLDKLGGLDGFELFGNQVLIAVYQRPEKTKSGIIFADVTRQEDAFQGKAGLVVALGPSAFISDEHYNFRGQSVSRGEWVAIFVSDGRKIVVRETLCRLVEDHHIRLKIPAPDVVY
jgi:co-chaperonin GroES (HSP10)